MNFLRIAWRDISGIFKNKFIRVSVVAIIIVPLLYSLLYLDAFWDPYSRLDKMHVAVVNMDKGSTDEGKDVNYGNQIVDNIKTNKKVGWEFVSLDDAKKGLNGTKYYAMFVIPEDFSEKVLSAKTGSPVKAQMIYTSNAKKNFIASQIDNNIEVQLQQEITKNISKEYSKVTFDNLYDVKDGFKAASDGSGQLKDGITAASDGAKQINDGMNKLNGNVPTLQNGVKALYNGSESLYNGLGLLKNGTSQLQQGLYTLNGKVPELSNGVGRLASGAGSLSNGLASARNGSWTIYDAITTNVIKDGSPVGLKTGMTSLSDGLHKLNDGVNGKVGLKIGIAQLNSGLHDLRDGIDTDAKDANGNPVGLKAGMAKLNTGLNELNTGVNTNAKDANGNPVGLKAGMTELNKGINSLSQGIGTEDKDGKNSTGLLNGVEQLNGGINSIGTNLDNLSAGAGTISNKVSQGVDALSKVESSIQNCIISYKQKKITADECINQLTQIMSQCPSSDDLKKLDTGVGNLAENTSKISKVYDDNVVDGSKKIVGATKEISDGAKNAAAASTALSGGVNQVAVGVDSAAAGSGKLVDGVNTISNGLNQKIVPGSEALADGTNTISTALSGQIVPGSDKLVKGTNALADGMGQLNTGISAASDGSNQLSGGLDKLNSSVPALANGVTALSSGADKLMNTGVVPLYNGAGQLTNGLQQLDSNVPALASGISKLADGSNQLYSGMGKLSDGSNELYIKLKDGSDKINSNLKNDSSTMGEFISEPLTMKSSPINEVKNYGTGFTGYFIPLSLWVGAIMMFFIISDKVDSDIKAGPASIVLGKFLSYGYIGVIQAVLASLIVLTLGLHPKNLILYVLFNVFMSYVFIAIIQALIFLLGNAGRLLSIVLLILQLTSCGGTFPMELVPKFFQVLNPFMPFTYCVSALRELISGVDYAVVGKDVLVLAGMMFGFLFISVLFKGHADKVQQRIKSQMTDQM